MRDRKCDEAASRPASKDAFWADVLLITDAVLSEARRTAYLVTGGSDGCAKCRGLDFAERIQSGHVECAREFAVAAGANRVAANMRDGTASIEISRVMEDPRFGAWVGELARASYHTPNVAPRLR